jgi:hypothetical protein
MHALSTEALRGLVIEETGVGDDSNVPDLIVTAINMVKKFAKFGEEEVAPPAAIAPREIVVRDSSPSTNAARLGMNLSYTINLNLPATSDIAVFNAIFKSLREHLIREADEA